MSDTDDEMMTRLEAVTDANSFLAFVHALVADRESAVQRQKAQPSTPWGPDAGGWENTRIETYLEAAAAWAEDTDFGASQGLNASNPWRLFAQFLSVGKIYEYVLVRNWPIADGLHDGRERRLFEVNRKSPGPVAMGGF